MEAIRAKQATIDDLLERILDKGIILNLDLVIGVAGIPLIGVNLRAAIAAVETMIEYGFMQAWDEDLRQYAARELRQKKLALGSDETTVLDMFGSYWHHDGIYRAWRPGRLYLTNHRLILYRQEPAEVLFQTHLTEIRGMLVNEETYFTGTQRKMLYLSLASEEMACLYAEDVETLKQALEERGVNSGKMSPESLMPFTQAMRAGSIIKEKTVAEGKMAYQVPSTDIFGPTWRPGWLYLTVERLLWWSDSDGRVGLEIPLDSIKGVHLDTQHLSSALKNQEVLTIAYQNSHDDDRALFSGAMLPQWRRQVKKQVLDHGSGDSHA